MDGQLSDHEITGLRQSRYQSKSSVSIWTDQLDASHATFTSRKKTKIKGHGNLTHILEPVVSIAALYVANGVWWVGELVANNGEREVMGKGGIRTSVT